MSGIVLGTRGQYGTDGAAHVATALAQRLGVSVEVVVVYEPLPVADYEYGIACAPTAVDDEAMREALLDSAREQLVRCGLSDAKPRMFMGTVVTELAHFAEDSQADMIVVGWGSHSLIDRALGGETALRLAQNATVPVLAISVDTVPRRVVVGTDFSATSVRSLALVARWLTAGDELHLVHVAETGRRSNWPRELPAEAAVQLEVFAQSVSIPQNVRVSRAIRHGTPARELLAYADHVHADLIALGSNGFGPLRRLVLGSVASKVMRVAAAGVLVVPPLAHTLHQSMPATQSGSDLEPVGAPAN